MKIQTTIIALALAGCSLVTTSTTPRSTASQARAPETTSSDRPASTTEEPRPAAPAPERVEPHRHRSSIIVRDQLETLKGLTPDQAKQTLAKLGHTGEVTVTTVSAATGGTTHYVASCGENKVCGTSGGAGIGFGDPLVLYINPTLTIDSP